MGMQEELIAWAEEAGGGGRETGDGKRVYVDRWYRFDWLPEFVPRVLLTFS